MSTELKLRAEPNYSINKRLKPWAKFRVLRAGETLRPGDRVVTIAGEVLRCKSRGAKVNEYGKGNGYPEGHYFRKLK